MKDENGNELDALAREFPAPETTTGNDPTGRAEGESRRSQSLLHTDVEENPDALFVKERRGRDQLMSQLAEAQRLATLGSWNWDMESDDRTWSDELYRIFGLDRNRPAPDLDTTLSECVHPDDREIVRNSIQRSITNKESYSFSFRIIRPDGTERIIHSRGHVVTDDSGNLIRMFGTAQDVTEREQAEKARREAEQKYRDIFDNAREGIFQTTPDGQYLDSNPALARMLGFDSPEELICSRRDITRDTYVDPERRNEFRRLLEDHGAVREFEHQVFRKDGSKIWISVNARAVRDERGRVVYYEGTAQDINARKLAQEELRESEGRYRDLVENSREFICTHDLTGKILSANRAAIQLLGYDPREFIGQGNIRDILVPEVRHQFEEYMARVRKDGATRGIMLVQTRSGERRVWEYYNSLRTEGVAVPVVRGVARDITEQRRAEESLQLFRNLIDQSNDAIEVIDPNTLRFIDCNESAYRSLGYSREEFLSLTIFDIDPLIDLAAIARQEVEMKESGFATLESLHLRKDGTTFPVEVNVKLVRLERDYRLAVVRDISGRQRAEKALRESEERYRELFENAKDAIYIHDLSGRYVSMNDAAEKLSGYPRDEIIGKHFSNFVSPKDLKQVRRNLCKKLDIEVETAYEIELVTKDRRRVPVEVVSRLIYENGKPIGVQGTARDISDRKRAQEVLQMYSRRLMEAQEAERQSLARELHDEIGQVLTAVRINLQSIQRSGGADLSQLEESVAIVDEALGRVRELSIDLRPSLLDDLGLSAALRWYVDRYAQRTGIIAEVLDGFQDGGRLPRELETACFRIAQAALTNVARHAQASSVSVQLERSREKMLLTVIDDGVGFDLDKLRKNAQAASALGLLGMEERALAVGGYIKIDSGLGRGTRVRAAFPLRRN